VVGTQRSKQPAGIARCRDRSRDRLSDVETTGHSVAAKLLGNRFPIGRPSSACRRHRACRLPTQAAIAAATKPDPVVIADPCEVRPAPNGGGLDGLLQGRALALLDETACALGTSREKLALDILEGRSPRLLDILDGDLPPLWRLLERLIAP
jgi:hypothetical protein